MPLSSPTKLVTVSPVAVDENKSRGDQAELRFCLRAMQEGLAVSRPVGDNQKYDVITDSNGRLCRVQVKSTSTEAVSGVWLVSAQSGGVKRRGIYTVEHCDFLAVFLPCFGYSWYVIPVTEIKTFQLRINQYNDYWRQFHEAWHLLKYDA